MLRSLVEHLQPESALMPHCPEHGAHNRSCCTPPGRPTLPSPRAVIVIGPWPAPHCSCGSRCEQKCRTDKTQVSAALLRYPRPDDMVMTDMEHLRVITDLAFSCLPLFRRHRCDFCSSPCSFFASLGTRGEITAFSYASSFRVLRASFFFPANQREREREREKKKREKKKKKRLYGVNDLQVCQLSTVVVLRQLGTVHICECHPISLLHKWCLGFGTHHFTVSAMHPRPKMQIFFL
jgi:hypothetical protein